MAKKTKSKLNKPTVALTREGYKFVLSFSNIDSDAKYIWIERWVYEHQDKGGTAKEKEYHKIKLGAKSNSSWSFTLDKTKYYPFVNDGTEDNPKQSDLDQRISRVIFKVWLTGSITIGSGKNKKTKDLDSEKITKTYKFGPSVKPTVAIAYNQDKTSFTFGIDINDDYDLNSDAKKVCTRAWGYLTKQEYEGVETKVDGYKGQWYNRDVERQIRKLITAKISPDKPVKYTIYAYGAGPGGKSEKVSEYHVFAKPLAPNAPKIKRSNVLESSEVDNGYGIYDVTWNINTKHGWYPVDKVTIQYRDQDEYKGASDIFGEDMGKIGDWSTAKDNIHSSIDKIQTNELGAVAADCVRYFRILVEHDGNVTPGYVTGVVGYGKPSSISGVSVKQDFVIKPDGSYRQVLVFKWSLPSTKLHGTDPTTQLYNGGTLGSGGRARILIFKNSLSTSPIKTIYYDGSNSSEWTGCEWVYEIPESDMDKPINYCMQLRVGLDNLNPGARSDSVWVNGVIVPAKCKNVKGNRLANNTTVEVTWDNPTKDDTIRNGVQIAWSTFPNAWESNELPSTTEFENGAMTKAYITGLTAGEYYYFWVRRYEDTQNGDRNYGIWSDPSPGVLLADKPDKPTLSLSRTWIKEGGTFSAQWTYSASGNLPQISAVIAISEDNINWEQLAVVKGEDTKYAISLAEKVSKVPDSKLKTTYKYPPGRYFIRVGVLNSMGTNISDSIRLIVADTPTCSLSSSSFVAHTISSYDDQGTMTDFTIASALRKKPLTVNVEGDGDLSLYIYSIDSVEISHPDRVENLFNGDCIWTSSVEPGTYNIENISLANNTRYRIQLECVDPDTSLRASPRYQDFHVHWEHQAIAPDQSIVEINEDGTATLIPVKPEGALDTDVCDIYRYTVDGCYLCRSGVSWNTEVIDKLPTFGNDIEHAYRFCTRTPDGDEAWVDIAYELNGSGIIIDYGNDRVELPWNVTNDDSRSKQGEIRNHLGGSKTYYGKPQIERTHNLSTEIIKIDNMDIEEKLYELSRYSEICYVRTSNGMGYPAVVNVSLNREYNKKLVSVTLDVKETDGVDEFLAEIPEEVTVIEQ